MIIIFRTIILYFLVIIALRLMGKKQIGQLQPSELAVALMISELASIPMESKDTPLINGVIPVLTIVAAEILLSFFILKNVKLRRIITGKPSILIENGKIKENILKDSRFSTDDLVEEMRINGITHISDVEYAFLETSGQVSFIMRRGAQNPSLEDLGIKYQSDRMPFPIINKGEIEKDNLRCIGRDEEWLNNEMKKKNIDNKDSVLLLMANHSGITFVQQSE